MGVGLGTWKCEFGGIPSNKIDRKDDMKIMGV